jgi:D-hydroxyproline dehydrogenase subunit gamma
MPDAIVLRVNGASVSVPPGATVAVAIMIAGQACRSSIAGSPRGVLCGMGICFECRAVINGQPHARSCQIVCQAGMEVKTGE